MLGLDGFCIKKKKGKRFYVKIEIFFKEIIYMCYNIEIIMKDE